MELSLLVGGSGSLILMSAMKTTYNVVTEIIGKSLDTIWVPNEIPNKYLSKSLLDANKTYVVRDKTLGGIILNKKGLFYLDGKTMTLYQYKDQSRNNESSKDFVFKLAPYVKILYEKIEFKSENNQTYKNDAVRVMMNDVMLNMILNDIQKLLRKQEHIIGALSDKEKKCIENLLELLNNEERNQSTKNEKKNQAQGTWSGLFTSQKKIKEIENSEFKTSYDVLKSWKEKDRDENAIPLLFEKIKTKLSNSEFTYLANENNNEKERINRDTQIDWDMEFIAEFRGLNIVHFFKLNSKVKGDIPYWKKIYVFRYTFK
jgi:hypothetical protein